MYQLQIYMYSVIEDRFSFRSKGHAEPLGFTRVNHGHYNFSIMKINSEMNYRILK